MSVGEVACTYACLILHDEEIPITVCFFALISVIGICFYSFEKY